MKRLIIIAVLVTLGLVAGCVTEVGAEVPIITIYEMTDSELMFYADYYRVESEKGFGTIGNASVREVNASRAHTYQLELLRRAHVDH